MQEQLHGKIKERFEVHSDSFNCDRKQVLLTLSNVGFSWTTSKSHKKATMKENLTKVHKSIFRDYRLKLPEIVIVRSLHSGNRGTAEIVHFTL